MYIKLGEKKYVVPDTITLGRGEPFDVKDRSLSRGHARLVHKKGSFKIKDLDSETGVFVNGVRLRPNIYKAITPDDKIELEKVPLQLFDKLTDQEVTGIRKISVRSTRSYGNLLYFSIFLSAAAVILLNSKQDIGKDAIMIVIMGIALKIAGMLLTAVRKKLFPFKIIHEVVTGADGVTFYLSDETNFSLRFHHIKSWHVVGKFFFFKAYNKQLCFIMPDDDDELYLILKNKCLAKLHRGHKLFSWLGALPVVMAAVCVITLLLPGTESIGYGAHFFGFLGILGLLSYITIEDLRELIPVPVKASHKIQKLVLTGVLAITMVVQYMDLQGPESPRQLVTQMKASKLTRANQARTPASVKTK